MTHRLRHLDTTPSARVLQALSEPPASGFLHWVGEQSSHVRQVLLDLPWPLEHQAAFETLSVKSALDQKALEDADAMPFEAYRQVYVSAERLGQDLPLPA